MQDSKFAIKKITECRVCGNGRLLDILSLGELYVSDFVGSEKEHTMKVPLELVLCEQKGGGCGLLQLRHNTPSELMYANYWYLSGLNESMRAALADITKCAEQKVPLSSGDIVLDIGCNDGTLLRSYPTLGLKLVGMDPAKNLPKYSEVGTTKIINDYFNAKGFEAHFPHQKAKVITAIAMFYDLDDPNSFVSDVARILHQDGVFIIQMSYLPLMLEMNAFDNICHEHLEYYSLSSLQNLLARHNLQIFDASLNDVNGGSFRVYCKKRGSKVGETDEEKANVTKLLSREKEMGLEGRAVYDEFSLRVGEIKRKVVSFITEEKEKGRKIFVYGASTKGNTLLQYFGLDHAVLEAAAERNPDKWGKKTVGTLIPIISEEDARSQKPDYFLVLPWHFINNFLQREQSYLDSGGKFIVPLPEFKIIGAEGPK